MATKRSGQAEMGSYRAQPAPVERRAWAGDQGNNKPSTNQSPRRTDSDSRTKRVEFCVKTGALILRHCPAVSDPFLSRRLQGAQSIGESVICRRCDGAPTLPEGLSQGRATVKSGCRSLDRPLGALPRSGTRVKGPGTKGAGISDAARRPIRRAKRNPGKGAPPRRRKSWRLSG